jgi:DNA-binding LacI/PurR family transcriptional regulator
VARVRMRDVAAHAGVSVRTVSNVVNGYVHVSADTRARVQQSLDELGYKMDYLARGLKSGRTGFIAMVVPYLDDPYFALVAQAVVRAAARRGVGVLVEMTGNDPAAELKILRDGTANLADGLLLCHMGHQLDASLEPPPGFPLVVIGEHCPGPHLDHVGMDDAGAARAAVQHVIQSGRERIIMIGAGTGDSGRLRYDGYRQAIVKAGLRATEMLAPHDREPSMAGGLAEMDSYLDSAAEIPDAVFAANDAMAIGVMHSLTRHGFRIPGDIAVIGIGGIAEGEYITPSLSSVAFDLDKMAGRALDLLEEQTRPDNGPRTPQHEFIPFRLIARESTAPSLALKLEAGPISPAAS